MFRLTIKQVSGCRERISKIESHDLEHLFEEKRTKYPNAVIIELLRLQHVHPSECDDYLTQEEYNNLLRGH